MKAYIILLILFKTSCLIAQDIGQFTKLSKSEFKKIASTPSKYLPPEINEYQIIIQNYDTTEMTVLERQSHIRAFSHYGIDTTNYSKDVFNSNRSYWGKMLKTYQKLNESRLKSLSKKLKKYGFNVTKASKPEIKDMPPSKYRYVIKYMFQSTKKSPDYIPYVITGLNYIVDRQTGEKYDPLISRNYTLIDLIKYASKQ